MKLKVSALAPQSKVTGKGGQEPDADATVRAIVKVSEPNYVPRRLRLRSRIDPCMITVECRYGAIAMLENDPKVVSVSLQTPMRLID